MPVPTSNFCDLLDRKQAAAYLRSMNCAVKSAQSLAQMACLGTGPPCLIDGNRAMYSKLKLEEWRINRLRPKVTA